MIGFFGRLLAPIALPILSGLAIVAAVTAVLFGARQAGKTAARVEGMRNQLDNVGVRANVESRVDGADSNERQRLRDKWTRD